MTPSNKSLAPGKIMKNDRGYSNKGKVVPSFVSNTKETPKKELPNDNENKDVSTEKDDAMPPIKINGKKFDFSDPQWKTIAPMDGKAVIKHGNNTWRWCVSCNKWMFHDITKHDFWAVRNAK